MAAAVDMVDSKELRVAVSLGGTDEGRSGLGVYVRSIVPQLACLLAAEGGSLVAIGNERERRAYAPVLGQCDWIAAPSTRLPALSALWHLVRCGQRARDGRADVLLLPAANRRLTARSPIPTVAVVHDLANLQVPGKYDMLRMAYLRFVMLSALRSATRIVAISRTTHDDLAHVLGAAGRDAIVVPNGVDASRFRPREVADTAETGRSAGAEIPYLLYPARLEHPGKNHVRLVEAFADSCLARTHRLVLAGADWGGEARIRKAITRRGLGEVVQLTGYVSDETLATLVAGATAVLVVGLYEGFGLPALEGLAAGRPVVVSTTGAAHEAVGALAVTCDPYDTTSIRLALERVVADTGLRQRAAREGPNHAATRGWDRTARGLLDACRSAMEEGRRATLERVA